MAVKTFGKYLYSDRPAGSTNSYAWGGVSNYANVYRRAVMPEGGYITNIKLPVLKYQNSDNAIVWGVIRNRATGAIIAQSAAKTTFANPFNDGSSYYYDFHDFSLPRTYIPAGTELWIGFSRVSNESNRRTAFHYYQPSSGDIIDYNDASQGSVPSIFTPTSSLADKYMGFLLTYETGGEIKVWNGSSHVPKPAKVWNGSSWVQKVVKVWNGSIWKESNS